MPLRTGLLWLCLCSLSWSAAPPLELHLLDGTRVRCQGLSFNPQGAVALRAGELSPLTFSWMEISPSSLPPEQRRQQEAFVSRSLAEAKSSAAGSPAKAKQIISNLTPLMAKMDQEAQERVGWLDTQVYLSKMETPLNKLLGGPGHSLLLPKFSAFPPLASIATGFPERGRRFVTALREDRSRWWLFGGVVACGSAVLVIISRLRGSGKLDSAQHRIRQGVVAGFLAAMGMLALTLLTIFQASPAALPGGPWTLLDIVVLLVLTWGLTRRSWLAAALLFLHFLLLLLRYIWINPEELAAAPVFLGLALLSLVCLAGAVRGAVEYQQS